jgi:hypothetical protein
VILILHASTPHRRRTRHWTLLIHHSLPAHSATVHGTPRPAAHHPTALALILTHRTRERMPRPTATLADHPITALPHHPAAAIPLPAAIHRPRGPSPIPAIHAEPSPLQKIVWTEPTTQTILVGPHAALIPPAAKHPAPAHHARPRLLVSHRTATHCTGTHRTRPHPARPHSVAASVHFSVHSPARPSVIACIHRRSLIETAHPATRSLRAIALLLLPIIGPALTAISRPIRLIQPLLQRLQLPIHLPNLVAQLRDCLIVHCRATGIIPLLIALWSPPLFGRAVPWISLHKSAQHQNDRTAHHRQIFSHAHTCFLLTAPQNFERARAQIIAARIAANFYRNEP